MRITHLAILGTPSLSSNATVTFIIIARNEHPPICNIEKNSASLFLKENSKQGTIITTMTCHDDDRDEENGQMSVNANWWFDRVETNQMKTNIPFEIMTKNNISEVSV